MLKKKEEAKMQLLIVMCTVLGLMGTSVMVFADPAGMGINASWIWTQLKTVILIATVGVAIMFYLQKATSKMIITIVVGALLYFVATAPASVLGAIGKQIGQLLGLNTQ